MAARSSNSALTQVPAFLRRVRSTPCTISIHFSQGLMPAGGWLGHAEITRRASTQRLERFERGDSVPLVDALDALPWNRDGLLPAIAQQFDTGAVLMLAWMNREALRETLESGRVCYFSRSRQTLWRKGESSGQTQQLRELRFDCDGDTILMQVDQTGPACHTGRRDCFYNRVEGDRLVVDREPLIDPEELYRR